MKSDNSWEVQFVVGKDGHLSRVETTSNKNTDAEESFAAKLTEALEQMPAWQPLDVAGLGMQNSLFIYNVEFTPYQILGNLRFYDTVDEHAQFPDGEEACLKWLSEHVRYPADCQKQGIQGRVIVKFAVNLDGSISDIKILRSPHSSLAKEAERVIRMMPRWKPAMVDRKPVRSWFNLPIMFRLR
jgi:protein TonB